MKALLHVAMLLALAAMLAVAAEKPAEKSKQVRPAKTESPPILGYLETRKYLIELRVDGHFTVCDKNGKVLSENITIKDLQAQYPMLAPILQRGLAGQMAGR